MIWFVLDFYRNNSSEYSAQRLKVHLVEAMKDTIRDLLEGHFDVEVFRIECSEDDETDIFGKDFDFSYKTIDQLRRQGEQDTLSQIEKGRIKWWKENGWTDN